MMSRPMVDAILEIKENNRYMKGIFSYVGFDTKWIGFHDEKRAGGQSKWNFVSLFTYALQAIYSVSDVPIQLCVIIGILCMLVSLVFIPHYFMIFMMMFFAGVQILCLSMIGEYASKCYMERKHRPIYIIKKQSRRGIQND